MNTDRSDDRDLREMFTLLREEDRRSAPSFASLRAAVPARTPSPRWTWPAWWAAAAAGAGTLLLAAWVAGGRGREADDLAASIAFAQEIAAWSAPTDAIHRLAPAGLPDSVPGLDVGSAYVPDAFAAGENRFEAASLAAELEETP